MKAKISAVPLQKLLFSHVLAVKALQSCPGSPGPDPVLTVLHW
jgi:hypothetical protein